MDLASLPIGALRVHDDIRIERSDDRFDVSAAKSGQQGLHDVGAARELGLVALRRSSHATARATRELSGSDLGAPDDQRDLVEWHAEEIMKD